MITQGQFSFTANKSYLTELGLYIYIVIIDYRASYIDYRVSYILVSRLHGVRCIMTRYVSFLISYYLYQLIFTSNFIVQNSV